MKNFESLKIKSLKEKLECVILGACIQKHDNFGKIEKFLFRTDFGTDNQVVFDAILYLSENNIPIDLISVSKQMLSEIKATKYTENESYTKINHYLIKLTNLISNTCNIEYHALLFSQLSIHYQLLEKLNLLMQSNSLQIELLEDLDDFRKSLLPFDSNPLDLLDKTVRFLNYKYSNQSELYQSILNIHYELNLRCLEIQKHSAIFNS